MAECRISRGLIEALIQLRQKILPDVASVWFADDEAAERAQLERLAILGNRSLTAAQRESRLAALDMRNPISQQAVSADARIGALGDLVERLHKERADPEAVYAAVAAQSDSATAGRIKAMIQSHMKWDARYAEYNIERQRIMSLNSQAGAERDRQIDELRARYFSNPAEKMHALGKDRSSNKAGGTTVD